MDKAALLPKPLRLDIQALRGWAVLLVVLYHAEIPGFEGGYLGVDIFFVISGFLITGVIVRARDRDAFTLREFYYNRMRRLFPATFVTILATLFLSWAVISPSVWPLLVKTTIGALTFTSNIVLWRNSGYFADASGLNPLLHMWSLSLEEQYYVFLPIALAIVPRRWLPMLVAAATAVSFVLCQILVKTSPSAAFYLLPTRLWELGIGSLAALASGTQSAVLAALGRRLMGVWLTLIVVTTLTLPGHKMLLSMHPGIDALLVCIATMFVLVANDTRLDGAAPVKALASIGTISYSFYLVHWPLIALMRNVYVLGPTPLGVRLGLIALAAVLAVLLYNLVEARFRYAGGNRKGWAAGSIAASAALIALAMAFQAMQAKPQTLAGFDRSPNFGLAEVCQQGAVFVDLAPCRTAIRPTTLLWGDSFAMHLAPGLKSQVPRLIQATRSECGPVIGVAPLDSEAGLGTEWAESCTSLNDSILAMAVRSPSIRTVIVSSTFDRYTRPNEQVQDRHGTIKVASAEATAQALVRMGRILNAAGKRLIVIGPTPIATFDVGLCLERRASGFAVAGAGDGCAINSGDLKPQETVRTMLDEVEAAGGIDVIRLEPLFCTSGTCKTIERGVPLFRDPGHLSHAGSDWVARQIAGRLH